MVEKIKALAKERNMKISDVEQKCKIGQRSIYNWDEHKPSIDKVLRVANYLGVTVDELVEGGDMNDQIED